MREKAKKSVVVDVDITLSNLIDRRSLASLVVELLKYLLYQRGQIPLHYTALLQAVEAATKVTVAAPYLTAGEACNGAVRRQLQREARQQAKFLKRAATAVDSCSTLLARLEDEILAEADRISSVRFLFGATVLTPKVSYVIHFPVTLTDTPTPSFRPGVTLLRSMVGSQELSQVNCLRLPLTNVYTILRKRVKNVSEGWFVPSRVPPTESRGARVNFVLSCPMAHRSVLNNNFHLGNLGLAKSTGSQSIDEKAARMDLPYEEATQDCSAVERRRCDSDREEVGWTPGPPESRLVVPMELCTPYLQPRSIEAAPTPGPPSSHWLHKTPAATAAKVQRRRSSSMELCTPHMATREARSSENRGASLETPLGPRMSLREERWGGGRRADGGGGLDRALKKMKLVADEEMLTDRQRVQTETEVFSPASDDLDSDCGIWLVCPQPIRGFSIKG